MFQLASYARQQPLGWSTLSVVVLFHLLSVFAIFTFTWEGLVAFLLIGTLTGSIGISFAYHRLLTHQSFQTHPVIKYLATLIACLALEGGPIFWVATHRLHHKESDKPLDPHSPRDGFLWAHMLWLFYPHPVLKDIETRGRYVPDLQRDPVIRFLERYNFPIAMGFIGLLYLAGRHFGGPEMGLSMLVWGGFLRVVYVWHMTWLVNSATHLWGYRNYDAKDDSTNLWLIGLLGYGEGWHNNHHGQQRSAHFGHRWWEFDGTFIVIAALEKLGLATHVVRPKPVVSVKFGLSASSPPEPVKPKLKSASGLTP